MSDDTTKMSDDEPGTLTANRDPGPVARPGVQADETGPIAMAPGGEPRGAAPDGEPRGAAPGGEPRGAAPDGEPRGAESASIRYPPPGWYHAQGDPPDTARYWDGDGWVTGAVPRGG
ncbi:MAG: hypothetical protein ACK5RL_09255 [Acidimicrobiales bacterium]